MAKGKKNLRFHAKFHSRKLNTGGRKADSNYFKRHLHSKKVATISHLIENTDQLFIVASLTYPQLKPGLIDRFLILAQQENVKPIILLTKLDLEESHPCAYASVEIKAMYEKIGYVVFAISNVTDPQTEKLREMLKDKTTAVIGHSGVGKTTMMNHVDPTFNQSTAEISSFTRKGRHTTTKVRMHDFSFGGRVYDMPGIKEMSFIDIGKRDVSAFYPEFQALLQNCQFSNCLHQHERRCAIKEGLDNGSVHPIRYENYLNILNSLPDL